ncbi:Alpha-amylase A type-1/2, partial [Cymbomonas tetramitiformis]
AHYPFPDSIPKLLAAYSYILTHPGIPCVFWLHLYGKTNAAGILNGKSPDVTLTEADGRIDGRNVWVPPNNPGFSWDERWPGQEPWTVGSQDAAQGPMYTGICGEEIKKMVAARSQAGIHSTSEVEVLESRKDLYKAVVTGRTIYGSSRDGASEKAAAYRLMVCIGPEARSTSVDAGWNTVSTGALHAVYAMREASTVLEPLPQIMSEERPHTYSQGPTAFQVDPSKVVSNNVDYFPEDGA